MRRLLGTFNYYRSFVHQAATVLAPLNETLKGHTKKNDRTPIKWTPELIDAFEEAKKSFANFTLLHYPRENCRLTLTSDASGFAVGAVLEQIDPANNREPLGFFYAKLDDAQKNWSAFDRELLALYLAVQHFEHNIEGRDITFVTDHRALLSIFNQRQPHKLRRRSDQIEYLSQFTNKIIHISGASNIVADGLSRLDEHEQVDELQAEITIQQIADEQAKDEEIKDLLASRHCNFEIKTAIIDETAVICAVTGKGIRALVPQSLRHLLFLQLHTNRSPWRRASVRLLQKKILLAKYAVKYQGMGKKMSRLSTHQDSPSHKVRDWFFSAI